MKKLLSLLLALAMVLSLAACGGKTAPGTDDAPSADAASDTTADAPVPDTPTESPSEQTFTPDLIPGTYQLIAMIQEGEAIDTDALTAMEQAGRLCTVQFRENGTGVLDLFGETAEFNWLDGALILDGERVPFTLSAGILNLEQDNNSMTFKKVSDELITLSPAVEEVSPEAQAAELSDTIPGTYTLDSMTSGEQTYDAETLRMMRAMGLICALLLNEDGTGTFYLFGTAFDLTWDAGALHTAEADDGSSKTLPYTLRDHVITLERDGSVLRFLKTSDEIEEIPHLELDGLEDVEERGEEDGAEDSAEENG